MAISIEKLKEIQAKLNLVSEGAWVYNPTHEMFMGTTHAIEMWDRTLDLGRSNKEYIPYNDETGKGYKVSPASQKRLALTQALGMFLSTCREDMQDLIDTIEEMRWDREKC